MTQTVANLRASPSAVPARIVATPGTCGGRPRLFGHRLTVDWYARIRDAHGKAEAHKQIRQGWDYLREDQIRCLSDYYEQLRSGGVKRDVPASCPKSSQRSGLRSF